MAKLETPLTPAQVARFRGVLDYYIQRGQPIVRTWPKKARRVQSPGERLAQCHMNHALNLYRCSPGWWVQQMQEPLWGFTWNMRDYFMSHYLGIPGYNDLPGQGHHPPQPPTCPGGDGHYFALLDAWAEEFGFFNKRLFFVFDRPLVYEMHYLRVHPTFHLLERFRQGVPHFLTRLPPLEPPGLKFRRLVHGAGNRYQLDFSQLVAAGQTGPWWGYIRGFAGRSLHPAISLTPWFQFFIPPRTELTGPRPAPGIHVISTHITEAFPFLEETQLERDPLDYAPCLFPTV